MAATARTLASSPCPSRTWLLTSSTEAQARPARARERATATAPMPTSGDSRPCPSLIRRSILSSEAQAQRQRAPAPGTETAPASATPKRSTLSSDPDLSRILPRPLRIPPSGRAKASVPSTLRPSLRVVWQTTRSPCRPRRAPSQKSKRPRPLWTEDRPRRQSRQPLTGASRPRLRTRRHWSTEDRETRRLSRQRNPRTRRTGGSRRR